MMNKRQRYFEYVVPIVQAGLGQIAEEDRTFLDQQRGALNLSPEEATAIEQHVLRAYQTFLNRRSKQTCESSPPLMDGTQQQGWQEQDWQRLEGAELQEKEQQDIEEARQEKCRWYKEEFTKALESDRLQDLKTQEYLSALRRDLWLPEADINRIERQVYAAHWASRPANASPTELPASEALAAASEVDPLADTLIQPSRSQLPSPSGSLPLPYPALQKALAEQDWREADQITFELLRSLSHSTTRWLDAAAIEQLPCSELERIDRLWRESSKGKFGLQRQLDIYQNSRSEKQPFLWVYGDSYERALLFSKAVGWWRSGAEFYKYYNQLSFDQDEAMPGQFPAFWFWNIPWTKALQFGGLGSTRGGCRVDPKTLEAWMNKIKHCQAQKRRASELKTSSEGSLTSTTRSQTNVDAGATVAETAQVEVQTDLSQAETVLPGNDSDHFNDFARDD